LALDTVSTKEEIKAKSEQRLPNISALDGKLFQPKDLKTLCGFGESTLKRLLNSHRTVFPPTKILENGFRLYSSDVVTKLIVLRFLRKKPFRYKEYEVIELFNKYKPSDIYEKYQESNKALQKFFEQQTDI
jgi:hypothetical protein